MIGRRFAVLLLSIALFSAGAALSAPGAGAASYHVTIHQAHTTVVLGSSASMYGSVFPAVPGKTVVLQRYSASKWKTIASQRLNSKSAYTFWITPRTTPGAYKYRVGYAYWVSVAVTLTAYKWHYLADLYPVDGNNGGVNTDPQSINGVLYTHVVWDYIYYGEGWAWHEWNLSRKCTRFKSVLGIQDQSGSGTHAQIVISTDSVDRSTNDLSLGQSVSKLIDISHYLRLRWSFLPTSNGATPLVALGNPKILCSW